MRRLPRRLLPTPGRRPLPFLAPNEPITAVSDGHPPSADGRSHRGSGLASAASLHDGTTAGDRRIGGRSSKRSTAGGGGTSDPGRKNTQHSAATSAVTISGAPARGAGGTLDPGTGPAHTVLSADVPVTTTMGTLTAAATVALTADDMAIHKTVGPAHHRGTRAGGASASHFLVTAPPAAEDATATTTSAAATLAASSSPDVAVGTAGCCEGASTWRGAALGRQSPVAHPAGAGRSWPRKSRRK